MPGKFLLGSVVATPGALDALEGAGHTPAEFLDRHVAGDWGDVNEDDRHANEHALVHGLRLLSVYTTRFGERLWVLTEADRSYTTIMLADEY
jgi:hypothetical protein